MNKAKTRRPVNQQTAHMRTSEPSDTRIGNFLNELSNYV